MGGVLIPLIALALLVVSFFVRVRGARLWAAIVFGLVVLQVTLGFSITDMPYLGLIHGANALAVVATASIAALRVRTPAPGRGVRTTPRRRPPMPSRRELVRRAAVGVAVATALGAGALAWSSTLLGEYSVMDMGGGHGAEAGHAQHGTGGSAAAAASGCRARPARSA